MTGLYQKQLARVCLMTTCNPTWDLSTNDISAIKAVLARLDNYERALTRIAEYCDATAKHPDTEGLICARNLAAAAKSGMEM